MQLNIYHLNIFHEANEGEYPICECCGKETKYAYETMYSTEDVECLCPGCIGSGEAARMFNGQFVQDAEDFKVNDDSKRDELYCRTPGYISWQGEYWLACCQDCCAYIGEVGTKELEEMGIADEVFAEYESMDSCETSGVEVTDHFREVAKMVPLGSGSHRSVKDYMLTRYACYLIAQNGDPQKEEIAFAQSYFAIQTRRASTIRGYKKA